MCVCVWCASQQPGSGGGVVRSGGSRRVPYTRSFSLTSAAPRATQNGGCQSPDSGPLTPGQVRTRSHPGHTQVTPLTPGQVRNRPTGHIADTGTGPYRPTGHTQVTLLTPGQVRNRPTGHIADTGTGPYRPTGHTQVTPRSHR